MSKINNKLKLAFICALLVSLTCLSASAISPIEISSEKSASLTLSLQQAQDLALQNNKLIKKSEEMVTGSKNKKSSLFTNYLPKFDLSANYLLRSESTKMTLEGGYLPTYNFNPESGQLDPNLYINPLTNQPVYGEDGNPIFNQYALFPDKDLEVLPKSGFTSALSLKQAIYTGGKVTSAYKMASLGYEASQLNLKLIKENLLFETEKDYWRLVSLNQKKQLTEKYLQLVNNILLKVENSYEVGMVNKNQVLQARVKYNEVALLDKEAENGLNLASMALAQKTGLPLNSLIIPQDTLSNLLSVIDFHDFSQEDYLHRYDYQMLKIQEEVAKQNIKLKRSDFLPQIGLLASYNYLSYQLNDQNHDDFSANAMAQLSFPIFQWGESIYKVNEAKAKYKEAGFNLENTSQLMILQINQSLTNVDNKIAKLTLAQSALKQADEYLLLETDNYQVGMTELTNLLNAQTQWQKAYSDFIDAQLDLHLAYKELEVRCGKYLP
jgi:outer membrane protein TolC